MDIYHMEIHRNKEWTIPVLTGNGNELSKAEVVFDETLHVRTWIDGGNYIEENERYLNRRVLNCKMLRFGSLLHPDRHGKMLGVQ